MQLPEKGLPPERIEQLAEHAARDDVDWRSGRGWSLVYDSPHWHRQLVERMAQRFMHENALSHSAFPSVGRFESAVISMVASLVSPGVRCYGTFTAGGTESILLATKAYRDRADRPDGAVVIPVTAHPAFGKAADYLGLELRTVEVGADGRAQPEKISAALDDRAVMVGLSAPCYPYGVVDPIEPVAAIAAARNVGVHVDAALGGLFLPFLDTVGRTPPRFGLSVPGVTSVSVDLHKYGYAAKGASVLLFASAELRQASYHVAIGWPGGAYAAASALGTRPVGPAAAAWASLLALGADGYRTLVRQVMDTARALQDGILSLGPYSLVGDPDMSVFAVTSADVRIPAVARELERRGWRIDTQEFPPAMHFITFPRHARIKEVFLDDLAAATKAVLETGSKDQEEPSMSYGVMVRNGVVTEHGLKEFLDERFDGQAEG
jgi:glutamate/tyrosine decarboxylase-like PLP-dependent enzyme